MKRVIPLGLILLIACDGKKDGARNGAPSAIITSHADGDTVRDDQVHLEGTVTDPDDDSDQLLTTWWMNGVELCKLETPNDEGRSLCLVTLVDGPTEIELHVRDPVDAEGTDMVHFEVHATAPPTAQIESPLAGDRFYTNMEITLSGKISDAEDDPLAMTVLWSSDVDGELDPELTMESDGSVSGRTFLSVAEHALTFTVTDSLGKSASDAVIFSVGPPNTAPSCAILSPENNALLMSDTDTTFLGATSDADQEAHGLTAHWTSDIDGELGSSVPTTAGDVALLVPELSSGTHLITLEIIDELDFRCADAVIVHVDMAPEMTSADPSTSAALHYAGAGMTFPSVDEATIGDCSGDCFRD